MASITRREALSTAAIVGAGLVWPAWAQERGGGGGRAARGDVVSQLLSQAYAGDQYALPPLPYAYDALEPHIDAQTMQLHHDKHHQGYVDGLNRTLQAIAELHRGELDPVRLQGLERDLSFNGGGHVLHTVFWATMGPDAGGVPNGRLAEAITREFGALDAFRNYYSKVAAGVKGSGWAVLCHEPVGNRLMVFSLNEHDTKHIAGARPLLPLDVWEHAYYLKYQNKRADYINAWWNVINWSAVDAAYVASLSTSGGSSAQQP
jgi:Fe-Mn family superoxide dismutase